MKQIFLTALVLLGLSAKAQYYQYWLGNSTDHWEFLTDGHNAYSGGTPGHFLIGTGGYLYGGDYAMKVQRTDLNGLVGGPNTFNNTYFLSFLPQQMPADFEVNKLKSTELSNGSGFAIAGSYSTPGQKGIFYTHMDPAGNITTTTGYLQSTITETYGGVNVQAIKESTTDPGKLFITGYLTNSATGNDRIFVIKINEMGTLQWSAIYNLTGNTNTDSDIAHDIMENPVFNTSCSCSEVLVVGEHMDMTMAAPLPDGFVLRVNANNGAPVQPVDFYGQSSSGDVLTCISTTSNPTVDPAMGLILAGYTNMIGLPNQDMNDMWFLALTNAGNIIYDHKYDYNNGVHGNSFNEYAFDVIDRTDIYGNYEYYMAGYTDQGVRGANDALIVKITIPGNIVSTGQYTYGSPNHDRGFRLDKVEGYGTGVDGLVLYGHGINHILSSTPSGNYDHYLVRAEFNGSSACSADVRPPVRYNDIITNKNSSTATYISNVYSDTYFEIGLLGPNEEFAVCHEIEDGDPNGRIAPTTPKGDKEAVVSPNPMQQGSPVAMVEVESNEPTTVQVAVYDMLGKQYAAGNYTLAKGKNQLPVDLSTANMAAGMYTVKISGTSINQNILLMVK